MDEPYLDWYVDIYHKGIKFQLQVEPAGHIRDGSFRYYTAQIRGDKFLPVDPFYFMGLIMEYNKKTGHYNFNYRVRPEIFPKIVHKNILANSHKRVIPGNIKMANIETLTTIPLGDLIKL